jgi:hypothetical protein
MLMALGSHTSWAALQNIGVFERKEHRRPTARQILGLAINLAGKRLCLRMKPAKVREPRPTKSVPHKKAAVWDTTRG